jgi:hypothetical protein
MMDAVEFLVTRDRMCKSFNGCCNGCEVKKRMGAGDVCIYYMKQHPQEVVEIVERWGKEHPRKTRQSEFLKMFPRASMASNGTIDFCPNSFDEEFACPEKGKFDHSECECPDCRRKYWLEEVDE